MDSIFDREDSVTNQVLKSNRFNQKWSTSKQQVTSLKDVLQNRSRSLTRQQLAKFANSRLTQKLPPLQPSSSHAANDIGQQYPPSVTPQVRNGKILDALASHADMDDAIYFDRESNVTLTALDRSLAQNAYSSRMSHVDQQSSVYHIELLEDRREEIQNIIKKRKQRAALATEEKKEMQEK